MLRIGGIKSFFAGLIFIGLAIAFGVGAMSLSMGTAARMGPGYFPLLLAVVLALLGILITVDGIVRKDEMLDGASIRGMALVAGSVVVFALSIESLGLVPAVALTSFLLSTADRGFRLLPSLVAALVLAGFSWAVFNVALAMPWPAFGYLVH